MTPSLSIVVPTRDRLELLAGCLTALRAEIDTEDEIVVADSASSDAAGVARVADGHNARVVRLEQPGASLARNVGWRAADGDVVAFIDDDVRVHDGWSQALRTAFADSELGFVAGRVVVPEHQASAERPVAVSSRTESQELHPGLSGDLGASANLAIRRRVLERVGGFDERLGPGTWAASAEDLDLIDRLFAAGVRGRFEPGVIAEHDQWRTRRELLALDWGYGKGMGVRLARLARNDPKRARRLAREAVITQGLRPIARDLRHGYEFGAATVAVRTLATMIGRLVGVMLPSSAGHSPLADAPLEGTAS